MSRAGEFLFRLSLLVSATYGLSGCGKKTEQLTQNFEELTDVGSMPKDVAQKLAEQLAGDDRVQSSCREARPMADTCKPYDQKSSPWCAGFSSLFILEENQRARLPQQPQLSILHFASLGSPHGGVPLLSAVNYSEAFEKLQRHGQLIIESELPFDAGLFDHAVKDQIDAAFRDAAHVGPLSTPSYTLNVPDSALTNARLNAKTLHDFEENFELPLDQIRSKTHAGPPLTTPIAPFDLDFGRYDSLSLNEGFRTLLTDLAHRSVSVRVCAALANTSAPGEAEPSPTYHGDCGVHAVSIVTARINSGRCQLLVLNSWGESWAAKGSLWIDLDKFVRWLPYKRRTGFAEMYTLSLQTAADDAPIVNRISIPSRSLSYAGETANGIPSGAGELTDGETVITGQFAQGVPRSGHSQTNFPRSSNVKESFDGTFGPSGIYAEGA